LSLKAVQKLFLQEDIISLVKMDGKATFLVKHINFVYKDFTLKSLFDWSVTYQ